LQLLFWAVGGAHVKKKVTGSIPGGVNGFPVDQILDQISGRNGKLSIKLESCKVNGDAHDKKRGRKATASAAGSKATP
jgi:hypothetical protein